MGINHPRGDNTAKPSRSHTPAPIEGTREETNENKRRKQRKLSEEGFETPTLIVPGGKKRASHEEFQMTLKKVNSHPVSSMKTLDQNLKSVKAKEPIQGRNASQKPILTAEHVITRTETGTIIKKKVLKHKKMLVQDNPTKIQDPSSGESYSSDKNIKQFLGTNMDGLPSKHNIIVFRKKCECLRRHIIKQVLSKQSIVANNNVEFWKEQGRRR